MEILECEELLLHGDDYFDRIDEWIERLPLGAQAPRDMTFARKNAVDSLENTIFAGLQDREEFQKIIRKIKE